MTEVEVTCRLDDRSRVESQSHVDRRYDVVTAMTLSLSLLEFEFEFKLEIELI